MSALGPACLLVSCKLHNSCLCGTCFHFCWRLKIMCPIASCAKYIYSFHFCATMQSSSLYFFMQFDITFHTIKKIAMFSLKALRKIHCLANCIINLNAFVAVMTWQNVQPQKVTYSLLNDTWRGHRSIWVDRRCHRNIHNTFSRSYYRPHPIKKHWEEFIYL